MPPASFAQVLIEGLARDGGLFVPEVWPVLDPGALQGLDYALTAARVLAPFTAGVFDQDELEDLAREAYAGFAHPATAPLRQLGPNDWLLELFHGPTLAFKDFALQLLGRMFERVLARDGREITIIGATSGDTGSAAIAACAGRRRMRIVVLHPEGRVSEGQRGQMTTVAAGNVTNLAIRGSFDDCQRLVKTLLGDPGLRDELGLAAVNSINWARVAAQAAYYVYAALRLGAPERPVAFAVPTGNFGDVYAGWVAARMGLPVARLVVATNRNDLLARFLASGRYAPGAVTPTISPSMDIQLASNFERLLFELVDRDGAEVAGLMRGLAAEGGFGLGADRLARARAILAGHAVDEAATRATMRDTLAATGLLVDPHTAVGLAAARAERGDPAVPMVTLATAHPAKFPDAVEAATGRRPALPPHLARLMSLPERYRVEDADPARIAALLRSLPRLPA